MLRDAGWIPGWRSPGRGRGNPFQYSCLKNPAGRGDWRSTVHRVAKSQTRLKPLNTHSISSEDWKKTIIFVRVVSVVNWTEKKKSESVSHSGMSDSLWSQDCSPFSSQEYWSGQSFPSPGDLPNPGTEPRSPALQAESLPLSHQVSC